VDVVGRSSARGLKLQIWAKDDFQALCAKNISQILRGRPTAMLSWLLLNTNIEKRIW